MDWIAAKTFVEHAFGVSNDALHVIAGVCLQLLFASLLRVSASSLWPWLILLVIEAANEWNDFQIEVWPVAAMQWGEAAKDVLLTMALPTMMLLVVRYVPHLFTVLAVEGDDQEETNPDMDRSNER